MYKLVNKLLYNIIVTNIDRRCTLSFVSVKLNYYFISNLRVQKLCMCLITGA